MLITHAAGDTSLRVLDALRHMRQTDDKTLAFEPGTYDFYPEMALEVVSCISNHNNDGFKPVALPILDFDGLTVEGNGAKFIFHDIIQPVQVSRSADVTLRGFSIDYSVTQYAHATVLAAGENWIRFRLWDNAPAKIINHVLNCTISDDPQWLPYFSRAICEYSPVSFFLDIDQDIDAITEATLRVPIEEMTAAADPTDPRVITLTGQTLTHIPRVGNTICLHFGQRWASGIFIEDSKNVTVEDVTVHHCLGMALLAQLTDTVTLRRFRVTPSEGRWVSAYADATHFVNCRGQITLDECTLEKHFDDCLNCHGIYMQIARFEDRRTVLARLVHPEQLGLKLFRTGERVELINHDSLLSVAKNTVASFDLISRKIARISFAGDLPEDLRVLDCIESIDACPDLTVKNCQLRRAFPRGLLITTRGHVLVENNYFHTTCSAIHISGDSNLWFESGCVRDVTIRGNTFYRCGNGRDSGRTKNYNVINIAPEIAQPDGKLGYYHENITITGNRFITAHENVLRAISTKNLVFAGNDIDCAEPVATLVEVEGRVEM